MFALLVNGPARFDIWSTFLPELAGDPYAPPVPYNRCWRAKAERRTSHTPFLLIVGLLIVTSGIFDPAATKTALPTYTGVDTSAALPPAAALFSPERHGSQRTRLVMEIKALVADSSSMARKNITRSLNEIGVRDVVEAKDGDQAIKFLQTGTFDVVFAEWNSQIGEGEELVNAVRKMHRKLPIIVTAPQSKKIADLKKSFPSASNYLTMPFTTEQLRKTVSEYVPSIAG